MFLEKINFMEIEQQEKIEEARARGLRPQVVALVLHAKKVLMVYSQKYDLWQFPQGGIENREKIAETLQRETREELGKEFVENFLDELKFIGEDEVFFPSDKKGSREIETKDKQKVFMQGKKYFFHKHLPIFYLC